VSAALLAARAYLLGIRDGWEQPFSICLSANVEHLDRHPGVDVYDWQDRGVNMGQVLRAGRRSEYWTNRKEWKGNR
jgi:hypothetical protein